MTTTPATSTSSTNDKHTDSTQMISTQMIGTQIISTRKIIDRMIGTVNEDMHGPSVAIHVHDLLDVVSIIERVSVYCQTNPNAAGLAHLWAPDVDAYEIYTWTDALAAGLRRLVPVTP